MCRLGDLELHRSVRRLLAQHFGCRCRDRTGPIRPFGEAQIFPNLSGVSDDKLLFFQGLETEFLTLNSSIVGSSKLNYPSLALPGLRSSPNRGQPVVGNRDGGVPVRGCLTSRGPCPATQSCGSPASREWKPRSADPSFAKNANDNFQPAPDEASSAPAHCQAKPVFASSRKNRPSSALFEVSTPPFSRMKVMGSAVRFPLPSR